MIRFAGRYCANCSPCDALPLSIEVPAAGQLSAQIGIRGGAVAALGPSDDGEEADAPLVQPPAHLSGGEFDVHPGLFACPLVLVVAAETGGAQPVQPGQVEAVLDVHARLFG